VLDLKDVWTEFSETGDPTVRERIIVDCLPLVKYVVGKFAASAPRHCDREELIQSGIFGLIDAIDRFDPGKGVKFETYAILRIRGAVIDELRSRDWVPRGRRRMAREMQTAAAELETTLGRHPSVDELADAMDLSRDEVRDAQQDAASVAFVSLDEERGSGDDGDDGRGARMLDLLVDYDTAQPLAKIELEERIRMLARAITELPEQERVIVTLYYYEDMRLKEIAGLYGVTESRISQIHGRALILLKLRINQFLDA
jgi:RNA polymerase sigma factor for flagellar operon FliA